MTAECRFAGRDEPRIVPGRHVPDDVLDEAGLPVHTGDDCTGCQPCTAKHCVVCQVEHVEHEQTCPTCITNAKERLRSVYGLNKHLAEHAVSAGQNGRLLAAAPIPGGDATVLRGPGSDGSSVVFAEDQNRLAYLGGQVVPADHKDDERHGEAMPTRQLLEQWEDVWRAELGSRQRHRTLLSTARFLIEHLSWAAQRTPSFPDFVRDIARHAALLEVVLNDGVRPETGAAPCFRCAGDLVRQAAEPTLCPHAWAAKQLAEHYDEPGFKTVHLLVYLERYLPDVYAEHATCRQGGTTDTYVCSRCHWTYDQQSYWLTVREEFERAEAQRKADESVEFVKRHLDDVELQPWQEDWLRSTFGHRHDKPEATA
jgi:hypothetical protein